MESANEKILFLVLQAIERAKLKPDYNEISGAVRIDSRERKEMYFLSRHEFQQGVQELKRKKIVRIESFATEENEHQERHFQLKPLRRYQNFYRMLAKSFPELQESPISNKVYQCNSLKFIPKTGEFKYGKTKGILKVNSAPWSVFYYLLLNKDQPISRGDLAHAMMAGWQRSGKKIKPEDNINIPDVIGRIRAKMKMGKVVGTVNKNLLTGGGDGQTYRLNCS